jgi:hypothetical protein
MKIKDELLSERENPPSKIKDLFLPNHDEKYCRFCGTDEVEQCKCNEPEYQYA